MVVPSLIAADDASALACIVPISLEAMIRDDTDPGCGCGTGDAVVDAELGGDRGNKVLYRGN